MEKKHDKSSKNKTSASSKGTDHENKERKSSKSKSKHIKLLYKILTNNFINL